MEPKLVQEPSSSRLMFENMIVHESIRFLVVWALFSPKMASLKGPKIASRRVQDRFGSFLFRLEFSLRCLIVLASIWVPFWYPKWNPWGECKLGVAPRWGIQGGLGIVLVRSFFRLAVSFRFFNPLGLVLGSFWVTESSFLIVLISNCARF